MEHSVSQEKERVFTFGRICRGSGKVYLIVSVDAHYAHCNIRVESYAVGGAQVPARLVPWTGEHRFLLIVPILSVMQKCVLTAFDGDTLTARVEHRIHPFGAHVRSALNGLADNADVRAARNYDESVDDGGLNVQVERIIETERPGCIVHCNIAVCGPLREALGEDVKVHFFDTRGVPATDETPIVMRDRTEEHPDYQGALIRSIQVSAHVRDNVKSLVIWPDVIEGHSGVPFAVIERKAYQGMRHFWHTMMTPGIDDWPYQVWRNAEHVAKKQELAFQSAMRFPVEPKFSIVVPLYHTPALYFEEMVESVLAQSYGNFELVLVNSTPDDEELVKRVRERAMADERIVVVPLQDNLGIAENTGAGITAATGDFLCFLDHDDFIEPDALFCYAKAINDYPDIDLLYSDEDKCKDGKFIIPFFKPDWDPELITCINYVCHFLCVRTSVVARLEPATREYDGAQDYHMILRVAEKARRIHHVPRVLYHWRIHELSTASDMEAKPFAVEAGRKAVQSHLDRCGIKGTVVAHPVLSTQYEVRFGLQDEWSSQDAPLVSIIIPNKDNIAVLDRCISSVLKRTDYDNYEIIVVENNSDDEETFAYYERIQAFDSRIRVIMFDGPFNFSRINNYGVEQAQGDYLVLLNNDTEVIASDWLVRMLGVCMLDGVGAVGAKLLYPDRLVQHAGVIMLSVGPCHASQFCDSENTGYFGTSVFRHDMNVVTAACLMTSRAAYEKVGGMDERFAVDYNDVDFCLALRDAGYRIVFEPGAQLYHYESVSRGFHPSVESEVSFELAKGLLREKWPEYYALPDAYGNPNLNQENAYYQADGQFF